MVEAGMNWRLKENTDIIQVWGKHPEKGDMKWECNENEKGKEKINNGKIGEKQNGIIYWYSNLVLNFELCFSLFLFLVK